jgi:hypothetical protein
MPLMNFLITNPNAEAKIRVKSESGTCNNLSIQGKCKDKDKDMSLACMSYVDTLRALLQLDRKI